MEMALHNYMNLTYMVLLTVLQHICFRA